MDIAKNIEKIKKEIPSTVKLVAVSKTKPIEMILQAYESGHKIFGENRVQELLEKQKLLPQDIEWHLIGHLQTNKVKYIVPFVSLIHSVDSEKLFLEINKRSEKINRITDCLLEIHIAREESKFGFSYDDAEKFLASKIWEKNKNVRIKGLMGIATFTEDLYQINKEFAELKDFFDYAKDKFFKDYEYFCELSMGMSNDYKIAIKNGATIIRVGSKIFGARN